MQCNRNGTLNYNSLALICIKLLHSSVGITQFTSERHRIANQNLVRRKTSSPHRTRRNRSDWKTAKSGEREWKKCSSQANAFQHKQRIKISHYILSSDFLIYLFSVSICRFRFKWKILSGDFVLSFQYLFKCCIIFKRLRVCVSECARIWMSSRVIVFIGKKNSVLSSNLVVYSHMHATTTRTHLIVNNWINKYPRIRTDSNTNSRPAFNECTESNKNPQPTRSLNKTPSN